LRDAYLEPWTRDASRADLLTAVPPADRARRRRAGWLGEFLVAVA
jgi:hypothetical protein